MPVLNTVIGNCRSEHVMPESAPTSANARPAARRSVTIALACVAALLSACLSGAPRHAGVDAPVAAIASKSVIARPTTQPVQVLAVTTPHAPWESLLVHESETEATTSAEPAAYTIRETAPVASGELLHDATDVTLTEAGEQQAPAARPVAEASKLGKTRTIRMQVTAYCACKKCCGRSASGLTASGRRVSYNGGAF